MLMAITRRSLLKSAALATACGVIRPSFGSSSASGLTGQGGDQSSEKQFHGLKVGVCSYSLRAFPLDQTLQDTKRLRVRYLSLKEVHLPLTSTTEQRQKVRQQAQDLGLDIASCGVIYLK